jgi:hypothetical protein
MRLGQLMAGAWALHRLRTNFSGLDVAMEDIACRLKISIQSLRSATRRARSPSLCLYSKRFRSIWSSTYARSRAQGRILSSTLMSCRRPLQAPESATDTSSRLAAGAVVLRARCVQQYALAEFVLPKLCRLRRDQHIPRRIKGTRSSRSPQALCHHVCRSRVVALSPPNHRRLPSLQRDSRGPCDGAREGRSCEAHSGHSIATRWNAHLSSRRRRLGGRKSYRFLARLPVPIIARRPRAAGPGRAEYPRLTEWYGMSASGTSATLKRRCSMSLFRPPRVDSPNDPKMG